MCLFRITLQPVAETVIFVELSNVRTTKTPSLIFASLSRGNFSCRNWKAGKVQSMAFMKFFVQLSLMSRGFCQPGPDVILFFFLANVACPQMQHCPRYSRTSEACWLTIRRHILIVNEQRKVIKLKD